MIHAIARVGIANYNFIQRLPNEKERKLFLGEVIFRFVTYLVTFFSVVHNELVTLYLYKTCTSTQQQYSF